MNKTLEKNIRPRNVKLIKTNLQYLLLQGANLDFKLINKLVDDVGPLKETKKHAFPSVAPGSSTYWNKYSILIKCEFKQ